MQDASFSSRVAKTFGGLGQWAVSNEVRAPRVLDIREEEGSDEDDTCEPTALELRRIHAHGNRMKAQEGDIGFNFLEGTEDDETEAFRMRQMIGMDRTLDLEEEEDEHDRVAAGMLEGDKLWMADVVTSSCGWRGRALPWATDAGSKSLPSSLEELKQQPRDIRADRLAAAARLEVDAAELAEAEAHARASHSQEPEPSEDEVRTRPSPGMVGIEQIFDRLRSLKEPDIKMPDLEGTSDYSAKESIEPCNSTEIMNAGEEGMSEAERPCASSITAAAGVESGKLGEDSGSGLPLSEESGLEVPPLSREPNNRLASILMVPISDKDTGIADLKDIIRDRQSTGSSGGEEKAVKEKLKIKKRVRFAPDVKGGEDDEDDQGIDKELWNRGHDVASGMEWEPVAGFDRMEREQFRRKSAPRRPLMFPMIQRMETVPDHVKNPHKYTCYELDWSGEDDEGLQHLEALKAAREAIALLRSKESPVSASEGLPASVMFVPKRKAFLEFDDESSGGIAKKALKSSRQLKSMAAQLVGESLETGSIDDTESTAAGDGEILPQNKGGGQDTRSVFATKSTSRRKQKFRVSVVDEDDHS